MINPMSAQLLIPLVSDGNLLNLFDARAPVARQLAERADINGGVVCEGLRVELRPPGSRGERDVKTLSIRLVRLDLAHACMPGVILQPSFEQKGAKHNGPSKRSRRFRGPKPARRERPRMAES